MPIQADIALQDSDAMRSAMVDNQLRTNDVNDPRVLAAIARTPREAFVPEGQRALAYTDRQVKLSGARALNPTLATARLLTQADVRPGDKVLLIGAATGYAAALLAELGAEVTAVEEDAALLAEARAALAGHGLVRFVEGPLAAGAADGAPYDLIFVDGAIEEVPQALIDQLADGGRLAAAILDRGVSRLCLGRKSGGGFGVTRFADSDAARLPGFAKPKGFVF